MRPHLTKTRRATWRCRRGLTLAELLVATTIMLMIAGAMATLAMTVHATNDHCRGQLESAQHARIALDRIEQAMERAVANEQFPGCLVVTEQAGEQQLPQTLVVWSPAATPANPAGLPLISELVLFAPDPGQPNVLLEIRSPTETSMVPAPSDIGAWRTLCNHLRSSQTAERVTLTNRLRTAPLGGAWSESLSAAQLRGLVRFRRVIAPSEQQWAQYRGGTRTWQDLSWPLDRHGATSATRVVVCQTELQMVNANMAAAASAAVPFFGSTLFSYELQRNP